MPRVKVSGPKISQLKKELRELRSSECPPISKMKKAQVVEEIARLRVEKPAPKTSLPEETISKLKMVEEETKKRNVARKSSAKALEGLRKVEAETKGRNKERKDKHILEEFKKHMAELRKSREERDKAGTSSSYDDSFWAEKPKKRKLKKATKPKVESESESEQEAKIPVASKKRFEKGSAEAKAHMAELRAKRSKK